jgi:hypothetical protein
MLKYLVSASALGLLLALASSAPVLAQTDGGSMPTCKANDPVVWLTPRNLYHLKGDVAYGRSPNGRYECLSTAKTQGAARGPVTPMGPGAGGRMMGAGPGAAARPSPPACKAGDPVVWLTPRNFYFTKADLSVYTSALWPVFVRVSSQDTGCRPRTAGRVRNDAQRTA